MDPHSFFSVLGYESEGRIVSQSWIRILDSRWQQSQQSHSVPEFQTFTFSCKISKTKKPKSLIALPFFQSICVAPVIVLALGSFNFDLLKRLYTDQRHKNHSQLPSKITRWLSMTASTILYRESKTGRRNKSCRNPQSQSVSRMYLKRLRDEISFIEKNWIW